jgi:hypothetical protein
LCSRGACDKLRPLLCGENPWQINPRCKRSLHLNCGSMAALLAGTIGSFCSTALLGKL